MKRSLLLVVPLLALTGCTNHPDSRFGDANLRFEDTIEPGEATAVTKSYLLQVPNEVRRVLIGGFYTFTGPATIAIMQEAGAGCDAILSDPQEWVSDAFFCDFHQPRINLTNSWYLIVETGSSASYTFAVYYCLHARDPTEEMSPLTAG